MKRFFDKVFELATAVGIFSFCGMIITAIYGFIKYPNSLMTMDPEFVHLSEADPELWHLILILSAVFVIALVLFIISVGILKKLANKRRHH